MKSSNNRILKYAILAIASPIILVLVLSIALYLPPIQNWAIGIVSDYLSEETGMHVSVDRVQLSFPLDLSVEGIKCVKEDDALETKDTVLLVERAVVDVQLMPLFGKSVMVDELELVGMKLNSLEIIPEAKIVGNVGRLAIEGDRPICSVDLKESGVKLSNVILDNAHIDVELSDTVPEDTAKTENQWIIAADQLKVTNSDVLLHMPGDTLQFALKTEEIRAERTLLNLKDGDYEVASISAVNTFVNFDNKYIAPVSSGIDANHLALDIRRLLVEPFKYNMSGLNLVIKDCAMTEKCGLELKSLLANVSFDSSSLHVDGNVRTAVSNITCNSDIDMGVFNGDEHGKIRANIDASIGKSDIILLGGSMIPSKVRDVLPVYPLQLKGDFAGNMSAINIHKLNMDIPTVMSLNADGNIYGVAKLSENVFSDEFSANIHLDAKTYNMSFIKKFLDKNTAKMISIPSMHSIADIDIHGSNYGLNLNTTAGNGKLMAKANIDVQRESYSLDAKANNLQLSKFVKGYGLGVFTGDVKASGKGFDYKDKNTACNLIANVKHFRYDRYNLDNIKTNVALKNGIADIRLNSNNKLLNGDINASALLNSKIIKTTISAELTNVDLYRLHIVDVPLDFALCSHIDLETDFDRYYKINGLISDISIRDSSGMHHLDDVVLDLLTRKDTTFAHVYCGDFETKLNAQGDYKWLMGCTDRLAQAIEKQVKERTIDQELLRMALPKMNLYIRCGHDNPIYNSLRYFGIDFQEAYANITTSREDGINGTMSLNGFKTQGYQLDTISLALRSSNDPMDISYKAHIKNVKPNDYVFDAFVDGNVLEHGISMNTAFYDNNERLGLKMGAEATMEENGIKLRITPNNPVIAYEEFKVNDNNYILLGNKNRIYADLKLKASDGTGIQVYSTGEDSDAMQDLTLSIHQLNIGKLLSSIPYAPKAEGMLNGDYHFIQEQDESFSVSSDMTVHNMVYEGCMIGNLGVQMVYMPKDNGDHYVDGHIMLDDDEVGSITGSYNFNTEAIDAKLEFMHFPMELANGFIPDQIVGLEGFAEGELTMQGTTGKPIVEGELFLESASLISIPYGIRMRFDDDPVRIVNSKLLFENFQMYASNDEPLIVQGALDFSDTEHINLNLRIKAEDFMLINSKENRNSEAYGKAFVNFYCSVKGELDRLKVRGKLDVLSSTNLFYILKDSPITTDNRLKELVTFVDFSNDEQMTIVRPTIEGMEVDMSITVMDGAHIKCWLNTEHSNYLDLIGGGELRMKYINDAVSLRGRYTIHEGEMKYSLPVIPLKTFTISPDSYVEFSGDMMNPKLNITATERMKSACMIDGVNRLVTFDCGVVITKTLKDMGLQFIIESPEEQSIKDQLAMMSSEERGKIAVTMLTTGMYLADGNTSDFSMNSALNSFLQSEINQIAGNALRTLDLSFGMDNSTEEDGTMHTDYTFKFAKRFWNNKLAISVGGKISSGPDVSGQNKSFFDNVEAQYRFSETSNQYLNLFYKRSVYDFLEGYVGQYGAGYMYKKKLQRLSELFKGTPPPSPIVRTERKDSINR